MPPHSAFVGTGQQKMHMPDSRRSQRLALVLPTAIIAVMPASGAMLDER
jgi:hypothetical protein